MPRHHDTSILEPALIGFQHMRDKIEEAISDIRQRLKAPAPLLPTLKAPARRKRRKMSAAARANIRAALKKRWAAYHQQHKRK